MLNMPVHHVQHALVQELEDQLAFAHDDLRAYRLVSAQRGVRQKEMCTAPCYFSLLS